MRSISFALVASLAASVHATSAPVTGAGGLLTGSRTTNILQNIPGQVPLPASVNTTGGLNVANIQGDILIGMKKKQELFYFFHINNVPSFQRKLHAIVPFITTTAQLLSTSTQPIVAVNLAFSQTGLLALNVTDNLGDAVFTGGQFADAVNLGDPGTVNWVPAFAGTSIHGVFLLATDTILLLDLEVAALELVLGNDISKLYSLHGNIRPGAEAGHEPFGFLDGISQPHVNGFGTPFPGQLTVDPGVILVGETGDTVTTRPAWATDGSFLAFRQLKQLVPEFSQFLVTSAPSVPGLNASQSADLLGARLVGRWKSGAPVDLFPLFDNATVGADPTQNNNFDFSHPGFDITSDQTHCPFDAHIRKTHPRADLTAPANSIIRAGIPFGPEVSSAEADSHTTTQERGLAFVSYQAQLAKGFQFLQKRWANNPNFVFGKNDTTPGFDPIIGANQGQPRFMSGYDVNDASLDLPLVTDFVVSNGGEYFFSPSISAILGVLSVPGGSTTATGAASS